MTEQAAIVDLAKTRDSVMAEFRAVCGEVNPREALDAHWPKHFLRPRDLRGDWSTPHADLHAGLRGCRECAIALVVIWTERIDKPDAKIERMRKLLALRDHLEKARLLAVDLDAGKEFENRLINMASDVDEASTALPYWHRQLSKAKKRGAGRPSKKDLGGVEYIRGRAWTIEEVAAHLGHSTSVTSRRYADLSPEGLVRAVRHARSSLQSSRCRRARKKFPNPSPEVPIRAVWLSVHGSD